MRSRFFVVFAFLSAAPAFAGGIIAQKAEEEAIRKVMDAFVEAYNRRDAKGMAAMFTPDADVCVSLSKYQGRDQIESFFAGLEGNEIESPAQGAAIRFLTPMVALMDVDTTLSGLRGIEGRELPPLRVKACFIVLKKDDRWVYAALRIQTFASSQAR